MFNFFVTLIVGFFYLLGKCLNLKGTIIGALIFLILGLLTINHLKAEVIAITITGGLICGVISKIVTVIRGSLKEAEEAREFSEQQEAERQAAEKARQANPNKKDTEIFKSLNY